MTRLKRGRQQLMLLALETDRAPVRTSTRLAVAVEELYLDLDSLLT